MRLVIVVGVHVEAVVDGGNDVIEQRQRLVVEIERAVGQDVALGAEEDAEAFLGELRVELLDLLGLLADAFLVEAVGLPLRFAVVGNADVFEAEIHRGFGHRFDRLDAVAPGRVTMERAAQVGQLDELRQVAFLGGLDLAHVLAQLGRDVIEFERAVQVFLGLAFDRAAEFLRALLLFGGGREAVLVQRQILQPQRAGAQGDVVFLAAGEIVQRERDTGRR